MVRGLAARMRNRDTSGPKSFAEVMCVLKSVCENSISKLSPAGTAELSPGR